MRPIDFILEEDNPDSLIPTDAMMKNIVILGAEGEYEILSYYVSNGTQGGCMFLDIQLKEKE